MAYFFVSIAFLFGAVIGLNARRVKREKPGNQVVLDADTFQYLKERDDELWEIEKAERGKIRFISTRLKENKDAIIGCMN